MSRRRIVHKRPDPPTAEKIEWTTKATNSFDFITDIVNEPIIRSFHPCLSKYDVVAVWENPEFRSFWLIPEPPELLGLEMPISIGDRELLYWPGSQEIRAGTIAPPDPFPDFRIIAKWPMPDFIEVKVKEIFPAVANVYLLTSGCGTIAIGFLDFADCYAALQGPRPRTIGRLALYFYVQPSSGPSLPWPWGREMPPDLEERSQ